MAYATKADLEIRFGCDEIASLTDRNRDEEADDDVVAEALADATEEIDGYLANIYTLPLATVPGLIVRLACDVARYRLWKDAASEYVRWGYEDAISTLGRIASGKMRLPIAVSAAPPSVVVVKARTAAFTGELWGKTPWFE